MRSREVLGLLLLLLALIQLSVFLWIDATYHSKFGAGISLSYLRHIAQQHFYETHYGWVGIVGCLLASGWTLWQARRREERLRLSADVSVALPDPSVWPPPPNRPAV